MHSRRPPFWPLGVAATAVTAGWLLACAGSPPEPRAALESEQCLEAWTSETPPSEPAAELRWPASQLWVTGRVPIVQVLSELERQIPQQLARDRRQAMGVAGQAMYSVRRLTPRIEGREDEIFVQVPLEATIEVCKSFGGTCLRYGSCAPTFLATFRVASALGADYGLASPRGSLEATRPCVIGLDVTPHILSEARKEIRGVEREIARALPQLRPLALQLWDAAQTPQRISEEECLRFVATGLSHAPVRVTGKHLELALGIEGAVALEACDSETPRASLPPLKRALGALPSSELWLPEQVALHTLGEAVEEQLAPPSGTALSGIEVRAHGERLLFGLGWEGRHCGTSWLSAQPHFHAGSGGQLKLVDVRLEGPPSGAGARIGADAQAVLESVHLPVDVHTERVDELLQSWLAQARSALPELELEVVTDPPGRGQARVHSGGILVAAALEPQAVVAAKAP